MPTTEFEIASVKWATGIFTGICIGIGGFFKMRSILRNDLEKELKLRFDLVHAEIESLREKNIVLGHENDKLEKLVELRLLEKEHNILCAGREKEILALTSSVIGIKKYIKDEFMVLHKRINTRRRNTDDNCGKQIS